MPWSHRVLPELRAHVQQGGEATDRPDLLTAHTQHVFGSRQEESFVTLNTAMTIAPVLTFLDPKLPFVVSTDASDFARGAVLQ